MMYPIRRLFSWGFIFFIPIALLFDCGGSVPVNSHGESNAEVAHLGQKFMLRVGKQLGFDGSSLKIKFLSVGSDSRCPKDVTCVWRGSSGGRRG